MTPRVWSLTRLIGAVVLTGALLAPVALPGATVAAPPAKKCVLKKKATCKKARVTKAKVGKVSLKGANLAGATISKSTFTGTNLSGVDFTGATITGTTFTGANLTGVDMSKAKISNTTFSKVTVTDLSLAGARLSNVVFRNVRVRETRGGHEAARSHGCTTITVTGTFVDSYICTGGGVNARGALVQGDVSFKQSVIPHSDFSGIRSGGHFVFFWGSDVSDSTFAGRGGWFQFAGFNPPGATALVRTTIARSVVDDAMLRCMGSTDAPYASFLGTRFADSCDSDAQRYTGHNDLTGARGLAGSAAVTVSAPAGTPSGFRTALIREDGFFRPGILCETLPCTKVLAVGAPVIAQVSGSTPLSLSIPGWTCAPIAGQEAGLHIARCSITSLPAPSVTGTVAPGPGSTPVNRSVRVNTSDGGSMQPAPLAQARIEVITGLGVVLSTETCFGQNTCVMSVLDGATVRVTVTDTAHQLVGWCAAGAPMFTGSSPPNSTYVCSDATVTADRVVTVYLS